jgi:virginiamycin B lyase
MRFLSRILGFSAAAVIGFSTLAPGATITGVVKGPDGAPFEGAFVLAQNTKTKISVDVLSAKDGRYAVENLPAGNYDLRIRAVGYKADPRTGVGLSTDQHTSVDFALQQGVVRWNEVSTHQGRLLLPEARGKDLLSGRCWACHEFQSRMASVHRDEDGWRDRVNYMRETMHFFLDSPNALYPAFTDKTADDIVSYLTTYFGPDSALPKSPADVPGYKDTVRTFGDEAMKIVYVEYDLPGPSRFPWNADPAKDGSIWIPEFAPINSIAHLDPETGAVQEYKAPNKGAASIHSAMEGPDGSVWFEEQASNKIGKWDPNTKEITEYQDSYIPGKEGLLEGGGKHTVRIDKEGIVWSTGSPFSSFDPKTGKFTHYEAAPTIYGIDIDKDDNVWFDGFAMDGKLFEAAAKTRKITGYQPPTAGLPRRIQADSDGIIWMAEFKGGKIARFDPGTETFKEYSLRGPDATPYALGIDRQHYVWYSSEELDIVGRLDPKTGNVVEFPFPHSENTMREFLPDAQGRMWWASPANNKVGYFYLAGATERAMK